METEERPLRLPSTLWARASAHAAATHSSVRQVVAEALDAYLPAPTDADDIADLDTRLRIRLESLRAHAERNPAALATGAALLWAEVVVDAREVCTELQAIVALHASDDRRDDAHRLALLVSAFSRRLDATGPAIHAAQGDDLPDTWRASAQNLLDEWAKLAVLAKALTSDT